TTPTYPPPLHDRSSDLLPSASRATPIAACRPGRTDRRTRNPVRGQRVRRSTAMRLRRTPGPVLAPAARATATRRGTAAPVHGDRSEEHTSELQSRENLV